MQYKFGVNLFKSSLGDFRLVILELGYENLTFSCKPTKFFAKPNLQLKMWGTGLNCTSAQNYTKPNLYKLHFFTRVKSI